MSLKVILAVSLLVNLIFVVILSLWFFTPLFVYQTMAVDLPKFCLELEKKKGEEDYEKLFKKYCQE